MARGGGGEVGGRGVEGEDVLSKPKAEIILDS